MARGFGAGFLALIGISNRHRCPVNLLSKIVDERIRRMHRDTIDAPM